ncbi:MAG: 5'-3' exonuclease H3TH domain-containing protein [Sandaracinaceae bacterium]
MKIHVLDGTYELFRMFFGAPPASAPDGREVGATKALLRSFLFLLEDPEVTHVGVAFDTVIESFRNDLFDGYKTGEGLDPVLHGQFPLVERASEAMGFATWRMIEHEADDALATVAARYRDDPRVEQVVIATPDKDLGQCAVGQRVVLWDRRRRLVLDEAAVTEKHGVPPRSIPDLLALVGDTADGIPGIPRWGAKSAAAVLSAYGRIEDIPDDAAAWKLKVRGQDALAKNLRDNREAALLYKTLATLRTDSDIACELDDLVYRGADRAKLEALCDEIGDTSFVQKVTRFA